MSSVIKKSIQLTTQPLDSLIENGEGIDFRLDEPQWDDLKQYDYIEFWEDFSGWDKSPSKESRIVQVRINEVFRASSFHELVNHLPAVFYRDSSQDDVISDLRKWWTAEQEKEIGVLGWHVTVV